MISAVAAACLCVAGCDDSAARPSALDTHEAVCAELVDLVIDGFTIEGKVPRLEDRLHALLGSEALTSEQRTGVEKLLYYAENPPIEFTPEVEEATFGFMDVVSNSCEPSPQGER